jgi:fructoselysine-6-P-deglycase FrlB-like protein
MPSRRDGPPYLMDEMIAAEPAFAERLLWRLAAPDGPAARLAAEVRAAAEAGAPIIATGCGTSEHGAMAVAAILTDALRTAGLDRRVASRQAFEAALDPVAGGLLIGVSHEGGTAATIRAMEAARAHGARVATITVSDRSPGAAAADLVVTTEELDQSWCHTIGYLSPILVAAAVGGRIAGAPVETQAVRDLLESGRMCAPAAEAMAGELGGCTTLVVAASGTDRVAARELALKIEEACHLPATARDLETLLHGHFPAMDASTGMILILADPVARDRRWLRAQDLLAAASRIGVRAAALLPAGASWALPPALTPAGRILVPDGPLSPPPVAALTGTAVPLQVLTSRLARVRGTQPDVLRRDEDAYREAAAAVE